MTSDAFISGTLDGRYWLTDGVARAAGVHLPEAMARGELHREALRRMVARCSNCTKTDTCLLHLAQPDGGESAVPDYCLNRETIETLKWRR